MMGPRDSSTIEGATVSRQTLRRIWSFARPYRGTLIVFLGAIIASALLGLVPPFVIKAILDTAIPDGNRALITWLAIAAVGAALADGSLQVVQRWASSRVGEGLIYDMRRALFAKVQRMPIAFFTRTPTGALTSRLNNDVVGAQNAVTTTLGSVVSNVVVLVTSLLAMIALEWRLTLLALVVLPLFVIPAKRVGRRLQEISREQMQHNASMSTQMTERFNVAGAMLVKLFGDHGREDEQFEREARGVRDAGIRSAMYGRVYFVALGLVGAVGAAAIYGVGAHLVVSGNVSAGTLVALAALVTRVYAPLTGLTNARVDLMTSLVSFERVFEVLDAPEPMPERPGAVDLVAPKGRVTFEDVRFRYPPAAETRIASLEQRRADRRPGSRRPRRGQPSTSCRARRSPWSACRAPASRRSPLWCRGCTTSRAGACRSTATTCATSRWRRCGRPSASSPRIPTCSTSRSATTCATPSRTPPPPNWRRRAGPRASSTPSPSCPTGSTRSSATAATACQGARSSASPSPACC